MALRGLLNKIQLPGPLQNLTPHHSRDDGFKKASQDQLFPKTDPAVDGPECAHDCQSCSVAYPSKFKVDESLHLYGNLKPFDRHIIVATGKSDWIRDVTEIHGSITEAISKHVSSINAGRVMISASNAPVPHQDDSGEQELATTALLLPSFLLVENLTPDAVPSFITHLVNPTSIVHSPVSADPIPTLPPPVNFSVRPIPHDYLILLCSHKTRDARCGQSAPLIKKELERHLRPLGLLRDMHDDRPGGVGIYFISHVGGHKFAANVIVYRKSGTKGTTVGTRLRSPKPEQTDSSSNGGAEQITNSISKIDITEDKEKQVDQNDDLASKVLAPEAAQCIWLARVAPQDCENLIRYTVLQGKVTKPERQLRGGWDRCQQLISW